MPEPVTETFATPDDFGDIRASQLHASLGERIGAQAGEAFMGGTRTLLRGFQYGLAQGIQPPTEFGGLDEETAAELERRQPTPMVSRADALARQKQEGLEHHFKLPDQPEIRAPVLDLMIAHAHERQQYDAAVSRGPQGFLPDALGFVSEIGAGMIDPVNAAAFSIPVVGEARFGKMLAAAGESLAVRAGVRAGVGAAQGAVGTAILQPADWWLHSNDGLDYTMTDALRSIVMGAGMGAAFHAGFGAVGDIAARRAGRPLPGSSEDILARALTTLGLPEGEPVAPKAPSRAGNRYEPVARTGEAGEEIPPAAARSAEEIPGVTSQAPGAEAAPAESGAAEPPAPVAPAEAAPGRPIEAQRDYIAADVKQQLVAHGRPEEEATVAGQLIAARYEARASRFKGALGTPEELYRREGAEIAELKRQEDAKVEKIIRKMRTPAARNGLSGLVERLALGKEMAQRRRNEGSSAVRIVSTAEKYAGITEEEWKAAEEEALQALSPEQRAAAEHDMSLLTKDDLDFMVERAFFQRRTAPSGPNLFTEREAEGQTNIPGTERISEADLAKRRAVEPMKPGEADLAKRRAVEPMKPGVAQKPMDIGLFSDEAKQRELFQATQAPPFYSAVARTIESAKQAKASPDQWLATIRNTPGVKAEELEWLGLEDWLKSQRGSITNDQIADYVRANQIEVKEVERGASDVTEEQVQAAHQRVVEADRAFQETKHGTPEASAALDRYNAALDEETRLHDQLTKGTQTKFKEYTLPGGENHRELLLTLPQKDRELEAHTEAMKEKYGDLYWSQLTSDERNRFYELQAQKNETSGFRVPTAHGYGDTESDVNRLAHIFMDDRIIGGKKTLLIKEAQSDWHAKGRHEGYKEEELTTRKQPSAGPGDDIYEAVNKAGEVVGRAYSPEEAIRVAQERQVPDAPFKTTWQELIMKRMIRYAAEHGYEQLAWVTGEERAARYDVSQHIDRIEYEPTDDGKYEIHAYDKAGKRVLEEDEVPIERIEELAGKEIAKKIENGEGKDTGGAYRKWKTLENLDLKTGGKMHRLLYDEQFPQAANKLGKKFGGRVGKSEVETTKRPGSPNGMADELNDMIEEAGGEPTYKKEATTEPVHTLPITDKLRDVAVEQGFPLFQGEQRALGSFLPREGLRPLIRLARDANVSTFAHESGHQFLEELMRDDAHPQAPETLKADAQTVRDWLGIENHQDLNTGWAGERGERARAAHEKFATAFEQYLREGVAPSKQLEGVFARFREWLLKLYKTITGLGEEISPEIRAVFDRMLATDEQIAAKPHPAEVLADLPTRVREDAMRATVADVTAGNTARTGEMLNEAAKEDPRIAESVEPDRVQAPTGTTAVKPLGEFAPESIQPDQRPQATRADWRRLSDARRPDDEDLAEASKAADRTPEPASIDPEKAPTAAEAAAREADALLAEILPRLTDEERRTFEDALNQLDQDKAAQEQMVKDGAACLAAAVA